MSGYVSLKATEKLTLLERVEHYTDSTDRTGTVTTGQPSRILAVTSTVQYDLWANVISRLEVRWDHQADGNGRAFGANSAGAADRRNALLVAANVIYKF